MYFWRIERLKEELRAGPLSARAAFAYVFATFVLFAFLTDAPGWWNAEPPSSGAVEWLAYGLVLILVAGGTYAAYRANGGQAGQDFAARYLALGWVLGIRLVVLLFVPVLFGIFMLGVLLPYNDASNNSADVVGRWLEQAGVVVFEAVYYWRLAHHFRAVAAAHTPDAPHMSAA